jgi:hypothetical protein
MSRVLGFFGNGSQTNPIGNCLPKHNRASSFTRLEGLPRQRPSNEGPFNAATHSNRPAGKATEHAGKATEHAGTLSFGSLTGTDMDGKKQVWRVPGTAAQESAPTSLDSPKSVSFTWPMS